MGSSKTKTVKKNRKELRRKRFKKNLIETQPIIQPKFFDGSSNWLQLQKLCGMPVNTKMKSSTSLDASGLEACVAERKDKSNHKDLSAVNEAKSKITKLYSDVVSNDSTPKKNTFCRKKVVSFKKSSPSVSKVAGSKNDESGFKFRFNQSDSSKKDFQSWNDVSDLSKKEDFQSQDNVRVTKVVAMDCEMVGTGPDGADSVIARVSIVNSYGECIYDEFVKPKEKVTDYRTQISGVRPSDLKKGKELFDVQKDVLEIINDKIVVGHSIKHDFEVLFISHPRSKIRDTAYYKPFRQLSGGKTPSLKKLTSQILGCEIQGGEHNSVEDAQAAMLLYLRHKKAWEKELKSWWKRKHPKPKEEAES